MKWFRILFIFFFLIIMIIGVFLEITPGKKLVERFLLESLAKSGLNIEVEKLDGNLPYHIQLKKIVFDGVSFDEVDMKINVLYLFKRELYISKLTAKGFHILEGTNKTAIKNEISQLPLTITIHSFEIEGDLNIEGGGQIRRDGSGYLDVIVKRTDADGSLELHGHVKGSIDDFTGKLNGQFHPINPPLELLDKEWTFQSVFEKNKETPIQLQHLIVTSDDLQFEGSANIDNTKLIQANGNLRIQLPEGLVLATISIDQNLQTLINWHTDSLDIEGRHLQKAIGTLQGIYTNGAFLGTTKQNGLFLDEFWEITSSIALRPNTSLVFDDIQIQSDLLKANGTIAFRFPDGEPAGKFTIEQGDLILLNRAEKSLPELYGTSSGTFSFDQNGIYADITAKDIRYDSVYIEQATFSKGLSQLTFGASNIQWKALALNSATFEWNQNNFTAAATGSLKDPLDIQLSGTISDSWVFTLNQLNGTLFQQPLTLNHPSLLSWKDNHFSAAPLSLQFGEGFVFFEYEQTPNKTDIVLTLSKAPLRLLSLNPLEVPISGELNFNGSFHEENGISTGDIRASIINGIVSVQGGEESLAIQGDLEATLQRGHLSGKTYLTVNQKPLFSLNTDIPMTIDTHPFALHFQMDQKVEGQLSMHGRIEEVIDFFNTGTHRIEGNIDCELQLDGDLIHPNIKGTCAITDGRYHNYLTGTELTDLTGTLIGEGSQLVLQTLTAHDSTNGVCTATGHIDLTPATYFPFNFDVEFSKLDLLQLDLVTAEAQGKIALVGDLKSALAKGTTTITNCDIAIPDKIPRSFPELQVVYKNAPHLAPPKKPKEKKPYPLDLDLRVIAPKNITINGRGLNSDWKGDFSIGGDYTNPAVNGKLELIHGEFTFAGKQFKLVDGSIAMQGKAYEMPLIDISANTNEKGISITARIKGPVNSPQITFQSAPPLPLSAILSYLIFGKDLSDVSGLQALQLASTIANVAGEGIDVLEMTRKSLGIDRLQIIMTPSSLDDGADTISLEVGKVIFPGFLVAVRQGAEDDSPNISIEVDLTHGFTLGLESQQQLEQGKFSLNWNINY